MRSFLRSRRARWAVPTATIVGIGAAIGGGALLAGASGTSELPDKSPTELLIDVQEAEPQPFSGTVVQSSRLGLPQIPGLDGDDHETTLLSMLTGSNSARIWYADPEHARFALMGAFDETDIIRNGDDVWLWSSSTNTADHVTMPEGLGPDDHSAMRPRPLTPAEAADLVLDTLDPSTEVTVDGTAEVAGRSAYELALAPRDDGSLIDDVRLSIDAETSMPLRFEINAGTAEEPAFDIEFTSITFDAPSSDVFRFNPPPDATVNERSLGEIMMLGKDKAKDGHETMPSGQPTVVGEGWTSVLVIPEMTPPDELGDAEGADMLDALLGAGTPASGTYGAGLMFETSLVSALWLDDGTLLVGAVTPDVLEEAATE